MKETMTLMTLRITKKDLPQFRIDVKQLGVKHLPFQKVGNIYIVDIISPESAHSIFLLKYTNVT